ncbi:unnamed protein product, partial [Didymodactylos carnosus]
MQTCEDIHRLVEFLRLSFQNTLGDKPNGEISLLKFETELLHYWLIDHSETFYDLLDLISDTKNYLWQYTAKILSFIDRRINLTNIIKENNGQIELTDEYSNLNNYLLTKNNNFILERLFSNRIHMNLILNVSKRQIKDFLLPLPLPLFQCKKQFFHIDKILRSLRVINDFRYLITQCGNNSRLTFSLYSWFIQYYSNIYTTNDNVNVNVNSFVKIIEDQLKEELIQNFEPIGIEFITNLCKNFKTSNSTYFQLSSSMSNNDVYLRVTVLRIFALFLSSKCTKNVTYLN